MDIRILHILHTSLPYVCGYSIRSDYILRFQREQGMEPAAVTSAQQPDVHSDCEEIGGARHWRTPSDRGSRTPIFREWRLMRSLRRHMEAVIREWKPQVIHAHSPVLVGLPALHASRRFGLPFVYEVRDLWENASVDRGKFSADSPLYRLARGLESHVVRQANAAVTICEGLRKDLVSRAGRADKVCVVGNGVDTVRFAPDPHAGETARQRLGLREKRVLGYVGTFQPYEGLEVLLQAMPEILAKEPQAHLVIVGKGGQESDLRARVCSGNLEDSVTFTGHLPHHEVADIYALCDLLVYPRILTRTTALTTPLKPLEAMAMGRVVLVSDVPGMSELVQPEETGLVFAAGNASDLAQQALRILGAPIRRQQIGDQARAWVLRERQWPSLVARYQDIYTSVLSQ